MSRAARIESGYTGEKVKRLKQMNEEIGYQVGNSKCELLLAWQKTTSVFVFSLTPQPSL
jgi:hypothetical protein